SRISLLLLPLPPTSTLVPYTTLFRSGFVPSAVDDPLRLLLGALDLGLGLLLGLGPDLLDFLVDLSSLVSGLFLRDAQDVGQPLADLLVFRLDRGLGFGLGEFATQLLQLVVGAGEALLEVAELVVVADDEVVDLTLVVAALADGGEGVFAQQVREYLRNAFVHVLGYQVDNDRIWRDGFLLLSIVPITPLKRDVGILI